MLLLNFPFKQQQVRNELAACGFYSVAILLKSTHGSGTDQQISCNSSGSGSYRRIRSSASSVWQTHMAEQCCCRSQSARQRFASVFLCFLLFFTNNSLCVCTFVCARLVSLWCSFLEKLVFGGFHFIF